MNAHSTQVSQASIQADQQALNRQQTRSGLISLAVLVILFILPRYLDSPFGVMAMGFGSAAVLMIHLSLNPVAFRSRRGSLVPAVCLVAFLCRSVTAVRSAPDKTSLQIIADRVGNRTAAYFP